MNSSNFAFLSVEKLNLNDIICDMINNQHELALGVGLQIDGNIQDQTDRMEKLS